MHPLVVISYNNHSYVNNTLTQARRFGLRATVIDNASDYEQTRKCLTSIEGDAEDFPQQLDAISATYSARKVDFALDLSDHAAMFQDDDYHQGQSIQSWEAQFWGHRLASSSHELYAAAIDTTFHLFDKTTPHGSQIRVAGTFTAKHLPWYRKSTLSPHDLAHMNRSLTIERCLG